MRPKTPINKQTKLMRGVRAISPGRRPFLPGPLSLPPILHLISLQWAEQTEKALIQQKRLSVVLLYSSMPASRCSSVVGGVWSWPPRARRLLRSWLTGPCPRQSHVRPSTVTRRGPSCHHSHEPTSGRVQWNHTRCRPHPTGRVQAYGHLAIAMFPIPC